MKRKTWILFGVSSAIILGAFFSCALLTGDSSNSGDSPEVVHFTGTLGSGFQSTRDGHRSIAGAISGIAAIPVIAGSAKVNESTVATISEDGTFDAAPEREPDAAYLLLLTNSGSTSLEGKASSFIALQSALPQRNLVLFPTGENTTSVDFGSVAFDGDIARSERSLETLHDKFALELDDLIELTYWNSLYMGAKNEYVNRNLQTNQWYRFSYGQNFHGPLSAADNKTSNAADIFSIKRYSISLEVLDPEDFTPQDVITNTVALELVPPETVTIPISGETFSTAIPLSTDRLFQWSGFVLNETPSASLPGGFTLGLSLGGSVAEPLSGGLWRVRIAGTGKEVALFDIDAAVAFSAEDVFLFYVPAFKIETDGSGLVTAVSLDWLAWDSATGNYRKVEDLTSFITIGSGWMLGLHNSDNTIHEYFDKQGRVTQFERKWYLGAYPGDGTTLASLTTAYAIAGFSFGFILDQ